MRLSTFTTAALLVAFSLFGCNQSTAPKIEQAEKVQAKEANWKLVTLHIDGFKKSKSGGT